MPRSQKGHWYILCVIDEMANYLITAPLYQARSEVGEVLIENVISKFGTPEYIIMDQDSAFISSLMSYLFKYWELVSRQWVLTTISHYRQNMV